MAGGVVDDLAGHGVKLELGFETLDGDGLDGEEVEKQSAVGAGGQRNQFALVALGGLDVVMDLHQVGGFAAQRRSIINNLDLKLLGRLINNRHKLIWYVCSIRLQ